MLVAGMSTMSAAEEVLDFTKMGYENGTAVTEITQGAVTLTFTDGGNSNAPKYYTSGTSVRMYGDNTMTVAVPIGSTLKNVSFVLADKATTDWVLADASFYPVEPGTLTIDGTTGATWTGNAAEFTLTVKNEKWGGPGKTGNAQFRVVSMTVTYDEGEVTQCSAPKFSLEEGAYYSAQSVALTCNTDGATIMYKLNGAEETAYTAPIELKEVGKYTIEAYAKKDGIDNSETVTATYEIKAPVEVSSIAEFIMSGEAEPAGTAFKWNFPVTVTAVMPSYTYVVDGEGSPMLIYGNQIPTYTKGDVIPAGIVGNFKNYNNLYEMEYPVADTFGEATPGSYDYVTMKSGEITTSDINKVIYISNATYTEGENTKTLDDGSGAINVYYQKAWEVDGPTSGEKCDVLCAVAVYKETLQVYPMQFLPAGAGVDGVVANTSVVRTIDGAIEIVSEGASVVYNAAGQVVATANGTATVNVPAGFYLVRTADNVVKVLVK